MTICPTTTPGILISDPEYVALWEKLSAFVSEACEDREPSHGHHHMMKVAKGAVKIYSELRKNDVSNSQEVNLILISAWLHDVTDHKYIGSNPSLVCMLNNFLNKHFDEKIVKNVKLIIENISYSKEKKIKDLMGEVIWEDFLPKEIVELRHIVSDADKLEALGLGGIRRCREYTMEQNPDASESEINKKVTKHANEKLFNLMSDYIRTIPGKIMALPLHQEMMVELNGYRNNYIPKNDLESSANSSQNSIICI